ncbi:molecular chaperone [Entomohabitans teleogrylli]|uniref:fimbrial biogenesis chaperone n=1 Tax=Entomohabitans teleogrylli TaxID=1384589 RepID=UPI00073DA5B4|nr:molecular chaperone [Entomohabitans teleogrylli]
MKMTLLPRLALLLIACFSLPVNSAVVITGTRVIYPAAEKEVSVKMNNNGTGPVLIQAWIDDGDEKSTPETAKAPFYLTPPVNRVNAGRGQTLRIRYTGDALPQDKESLFYLNVLEVPPKAKDSKDQNVLQMAFRSRLKLFFRPASLTGKAAAQAPEKLLWSRDGNRITARNTTPFHITVAYLAEDDKGEKPLSDGGMINPSESMTLTLSKSVSRYYPVIINDFGALRVINPTAK